VAGYTPAPEQDKTTHGTLISKRNGGECKDSIYTIIKFDQDIYNIAYIPDMHQPGESLYKHWQSLQANAVH